MILFSIRIIQIGVFVLCGDFNSVCADSERKCIGLIARSDDIIHFNKFIDDCMLIDLPLAGIRFTWFHGDGFSISRLDRFLISED